MSATNTPQRAIERLWPEVMTSPELHFHQFDPIQQAGLFVEMPPGAYRAASFLDSRGIPPQAVAGWFSWQQIRQAVLQGNAPEGALHFIFHIGHTGSTLLSRLLDETNAVQSLREPLVLRELAELHDVRGLPSALMSPAEIDAVGETLLRLWSRVGEGRQCTVVKATSTTARIAALLMKARPKAQAVCLSMAADKYLAVVLGGPASLRDVRGQAGERMRRMQQQLGEAPKAVSEMSPGELVAASWVTENLTHQALAEATGARVLNVDFDGLLARPVPVLEQVLQHFSIPGGAEMAARMAHSPIMGRYAKAPEHAYSSRLRDEVIHQARQQHGTEITRGTRFVETLAKRYAPVAKLLEQEEAG